MWHPNFFKASKGQKINDLHNVNVQVFRRYICTFYAKSQVRRLYQIIFRFTVTTDFVYKGFDQKFGF